MNKNEKGEPFKIVADYVDVQGHLKAIKERYSRIDIVDLFHDKKEVKATMNGIYDILLDGFEFKEIRNYECALVMHDDIVMLPLKSVLVQLMLLKPIGKLGMITDVSLGHIVDFKTFSGKTVESFSNKFIIEPYRHLISDKKLNRLLDDMKDDLAQISKDFNILLGLTMNIEVFIDLARKYPEYDDIIRTKIEEGSQPADIERLLKRKLDRSLEIIANDDDNILKPCIVTGVGIKTKQLSEMTISGGLKPDITGRTIPIPINANILVGGLASVVNYYIDAVGGRKALIMNKTEMGTSGIFSRKVIMLTSDQKLSQDIYDCKTTRPIRVFIKDMRTLNRFIGRNAKLMGERKYREITSESTDLIGNTIFLRSPVTCASHRICKMCYGEELHNINKSISAGSYASIRITEPVSQNILSAKHVLNTNSTLVEFESEIFNKFFEISANEILFKPDDEYSFTKYKLLILQDNLISIHEYDENDYNSFTKIVHLLDTETGEIFDITEKNGIDMYPTRALIELINKSKPVQLSDSEHYFYEIDLNDIELDEAMFVVEIDNSELTKPLYDIMKLLNMKDHLGVSTIDGMVQKLLELLLISNINAMNVHAEMIIRALVRTSKDILIAPDFKHFITDDDYKILTVDASLLNNPSVIISFSSQELKRQLTSPLTFKKRSDSYLDPLFKTTLE